MFTGIVRELGHLTAAPEDSGQGGVRLRIGHSAELGAQLTLARAWRSPACA